jgi:hypothetical protein
MLVGQFLPFVFLVVWLGLIVYLILLATRLVDAVERIAVQLSGGNPDSSKP